MPITSASWAALRFCCSRFSTACLFSFAEMLVGPLIPTTVNALAPTHAKASYMAATSVASDLKERHCDDQRGRASR